MGGRSPLTSLGAYHDTDEYYKDFQLMSQHSSLEQFMFRDVSLILRFENGGSFITYSAHFKRQQQFLIRPEIELTTLTDNTRDARI